MKKFALMLDIKQAEELIHAVDYYFRQLNKNAPQWVLELKQKHFSMTQEEKYGKRNNIK